MKSRMILLIVRWMFLGAGVAVGEDLGKLRVNPLAPDSTANPS